MMTTQQLRQPQSRRHHCQAIASGVITQPRKLTHQGQVRRPPMRDPRHIRPSRRIPRQPIPRTGILHLKRQRGFPQVVPPRPARHQRPRPTAIHLNLGIKPQPPYHHPALRFRQMLIPQPPSDRRHVQKMPNQRIHHPWRQALRLPPHSQIQPPLSPTTRQRQRALVHVQTVTGTTDNLSGFQPLLPDQGKRDRHPLRDEASPAARGQRVSATRTDIATRSIPGCAGRTRRVKTAAPMAAEHPRLRGEDRWQPGYSDCSSGASPAARGGHRRGLRRCAARRSIPGCAGRTVRRRPERR